ncbi:zwei Ig domain protein zig-8-like isoform X2 [Ruditapes philippinarum]|uniref:zwei Ig domain protein zig-8-like isoform X2 n=1 Tax=Ruditapes philippinarum TaxID=129788 RepID=UPI00295A66AB|nr:zwei Ig domain protein zig-8-like isoform X2 [Ruditapes philippinarum]
MCWIKNRFKYIQQVTFLLFLAFLEADSRESFYRHYPSSIPSFLPVPTNITVHEGETARLRCRITNLGPKMVVWRKANDESPLTLGKMSFTPNKNIKIQTESIEDADGEEDRYDLIIKDVQQEQAGTYECRVSAMENYTQNITLHVLDPVEYKPELRLQGTKYVSLMENVHLICNATGSSTAPDGVDWFFNGDPINEMNPRWHGRLYEINKKPLPGRSLISEIIIEKATMEDRGHYVCRLTKVLAEGFKVHVLNDRKNHKEPKRDMKDDKSETSLFSKDSNSGSSRWNYIQVSCITTFCYFITYIIHR